MVDVFISYKREDHVRVERLAALLDELGLQVWYDAALGAGDDWKERIESVARQATCILVCWTDEAAQSEWVQREVSIGLQRGNLATAKFAHPCSIPPHLNDAFHFADLSDWSEGAEHKGLAQLVSGLERRSGVSLSAKLQERAGSENADVVSQLRAFLVSVARAKGPPVRYEDAYRNVADAWLNQHKTPMPSLWGALDAIAEQNRSRREPPLFALVVTKSGIPGRGYFQKHCFLAGGDNEDSRLIHQLHLKRVYQYPWPNDP